jgi:hypothetical protein
VELIRVLREKQRALQNLELVDIYNEAVRSSFFSINHAGSGAANRKAAAKAPSKTSVKKKYQNLASATAQMAQTTGQQHRHHH